LEEQSYAFVAGNGRECGEEERDEAQEGGHVSIVAAHMGCAFILRLVGKVRVFLLHGEGVHVSPEGHAVVFA
jgi:hypothetical protein